MFKRKLRKSFLNLKHQRSCDVVFDFKGILEIRIDFVVDSKFNSKPNDHMYKLIETLLPKSMELIKKNQSIKFIEL